MIPLAETETDRLLQEAVRLHAIGQPERAIDLLHHALQRQPGHVLALNKLASIALERRDAPTAIANAEAVLQQEPNFAPALSTLAQAHWLAGDPAGGLPFARRAMEIQPSNAEFRLTCAHLCVWLGHGAEADRILQPLLTESWHDTVTRARIRNMAAERLIAQGRFRDAVAPLRESLAIAPDLPATHMLLGTNLLRLGEFAEGWRSYAAREQVRFFYPQGKDPDLLGQSWRGGDVRGRSILLRDDQGYGDAIQFFRYIRLLRQAGAGRIVLHTFPLLKDLLAASTRDAEVTDAPPVDFHPDLHCLTAGLPGAFGTRLDTIPADCPYLTPPRKPPAHLRLPRGGMPRVGLVWSGDPRHLSDHLRSIPARLFLRLTRQKGIRFHSLQHIVRPGDLKALEACPAVDRIGERVGSFLETASVVSQLDLVITVDTSVAHLSGALGKPTWVLLPLAPDWRWLADREDSPWYPTMRLFRSDGSGWDPVLKRVATALRRWAG